MKKSGSRIIMSHCIRLMLFLIIVLNIRSVSAASPIRTSRAVEVVSGKTYNRYDFTGDGTSDVFAASRQNLGGEGYWSIGLGGQHLMNLPNARGGSMYIIAPTPKRAYLVVEFGGFGCNTLKLYRYTNPRNPKFEEVCSSLGGALDYSSPKHVYSNGLLYVRMYSGKHDQQIFSLNHTAQFNAKYVISGSGTCKLKSNFALPVGNKKFEAACTFRTGSNSRSGVKGPLVKKGQTVTLKRMYIGPIQSAHKAIEIKVGNRTGWINKTTLKNYSKNGSLLK